MPKKEKQPTLPVMDPDDFDREAVFRAIGYEPDDWQRMFHDSDARYRVLACGVRVGKTFCMVAEAVAAVVCPSKASLEAGEWIGSRGWIVAPTYDTADKLFLQVARHLKKHFPWLITKYSERERIVRTLGGGYVQAKSTDNPDSLLSEELDWAVIDEAPRTKDQDKENVRQRLLTRDGWMAAIGSPVPCPWFVRDFEKGQGLGFHYEFAGEPIEGARFAGLDVKFVKANAEVHPDYFSIRVPTHANKRLDVKALAEFESMPDRIFRQDILAEFMGSAGEVFRDFARLSTAERLTNGKPGQRYVIGWDVARAKDYSVVSVLDYQTREQVFMARFQGPWNVQIERVIAIARRFNRPDIVVDATGKGDPIAEELVRRNNQAAAWVATDPANLPPGVTREQARLGPFAGRVEPLQITNNSLKRDLVETLAVGFDQGELTILDDPIQSQELRLYQFKQSDATGVIRYGAPSGFHDDTVMALALAWWRCTRPMGTSQFLMF